MIPHLCFEIGDPSGVGEARRAASHLALDLGLDELAVGRVALVATELGHNLHRHAGSGRLLVGRAVDARFPAVDLLSLDSGPGMADLAACMRDGFSTAGTPGTGLGAVRRLADGFSAWSRPGQGAIVWARIAAPRPPGATLDDRFSVGGVCLPAPGEHVSGDGWAFRSEGSQAGVLLVDGLGHGPDAAVASDAALAVFERSPLDAPLRVLERAHQALHGTRGAAGSMGRLDASAGTLAWCGAGNVAGRVLTGLEDRSLLSQHGTLGLQVRRLRDDAYAWGDHATLVLHSDGIVTRWSVDDAPGLLRCDPAVIAGWLIRDHLRGRDDATVVVIRRNVR